MNTINRNYLPKLDIRETQEAINLINDSLVKNITELFEIILVREPIVSSKKITTNITTIRGERQINFDGSNDNVIYYIYNNYRYWLVNTLKKLNIQNNNAIGTFVKYIDRDSEVKNTQSMEKRQFHIEYRYDSIENIFEKAIEINALLIEAIRNIELDVAQRFKKIKPILKKKIVEKTLNRISNKTNLEQALADIGADEKIFTLINRKKNNISTNNTFEITLNTYSKEIDESYKIFKIQDRRTMEDIEPETVESDSVMEEYLFGKEVLGDNKLRSINVEIDLDALCMFILNKSHILEIQSGLNISDIERILSGADIKHL